MAELFFACRTPHGGVRFLACRNVQAGSVAFILSKLASQLLQYRFCCFSLISPLSVTVVDALVLLKVLYLADRHRLLTFVQLRFQVKMPYLYDESGYVADWGLPNIVCRIESVVSLMLNADEA